MERITFKRNYNHKLGNNYFITIREKASKWLVGEVYEVFDKESCSTRGHGKIIEIREITTHDLNDWVTFLDAGLSASEFILELESFYGPEIRLKRLQLLLFQRVQVKHVQATLF